MSSLSINKSGKEYSCLKEDPLSRVDANHVPHEITWYVNILNMKVTLRLFKKTEKGFLVTFITCGYCMF